MKLRHVFFLLFVPGVVLPYVYFVPWFTENGLNVRLFFAESFAIRVLREKKVEFVPHVFDIIEGN